MTDTTSVPKDTRDASAPDGGARRDTVRGFVESARLSARQQGLPVPPHGPLPREVLARYRRHQSRE